MQILRFLKDFGRAELEVKNYSLGGTFPVFSWRREGQLR